MVLLIDVTFNWFKVGRLVCVVMMTPDQTLLSCIDGSDAVIDVKRAINGFIVTNYPIRLLELVLHPLSYYCTVLLS